MSEMIIAAFKITNNARFAVAALRDAGIAPEHIGLLAHEADADTDFRTFKELESHHASKGAVIGAAAGAGTGVVWALGIAAGLLPAVGPIVAGGLLGAVLTSGVFGAAAAGIAGALVGLGISDEEAAYFEEEFRSGGTIVAVTCSDEAMRTKARDILNERHAYFPGEAADVPLDASLQTPPTPVRPH